ncbi:MAG TPA: hypothetical protein PLC74_13655 [Acetobacteraceae bacterium]|nr:hypothetical protein [Acetobacteraceae bacterium]
MSGPAGIPAERTEQIRYSLPLTKSLVFSVAAEDPRAGHQDTRDNIEVPTRSNPMPDFSAKYEYTTKAVHLQVSGLARDFAYTDQNGHRLSQFGGAGIIGATYNLASLNKVFVVDN